MSTPDPPARQQWARHTVPSCLSTVAHPVSLSRTSTRKRIRIPLGSTEGAKEADGRQPQVLRAARRPPPDGGRQGPAQSPQQLLPLSVPGGGGLAGREAAPRYTIGPLVHKAGPEDNVAAGRCPRGSLRCLKTGNSPDSKDGPAHEAISQRVIGLQIPTAGPEETMSRSHSKQRDTSEPIFGTNITTASIKDLRRRSCVPFPTAGSGPQQPTPIKLGDLMLICRLHLLLLFLRWAEVETSTTGFLPPPGLPRPSSTWANAGCAGICPMCGETECPKSSWTIAALAGAAQLWGCIWAWGCHHDQGSCQP